MEIKLTTFYRQQNALRQTKISCITCLNGNKVRRISPVLIMLFRADYAV
jgi:hypothetical protein